MSGAATQLSDSLGLKQPLDDLGKGARETWDDLTGKSSADAAKEASETQAAYQQDALEYLKGIEEQPQKIRREALTELKGLFGLGGESTMANQSQMIDAARNSPIYQAILGTQGASEDAIMRTAGATGGLRSGNVQSNLAENAQQLEQNALMQGYNQQLSERNQRIAGLSGLGNLPSYAGQIASGMGGIGNTLAQGQVGAAQAQQAGLGNLLNFGIGAGKAYFSDIRLKDDIQYEGVKNGHNWYSWVWNRDAEKLGLSGSDSGVMAHEVIDKNSELVGTSDGYLTVNYGGINNA